MKRYSNNYLGLGFNVEKAPWWGGILERMVRSTKRCLKKIVGRAKLSYDELLTAITKVEIITYQVIFTNDASVSVEVVPCEGGQICRQLVLQYSVALCCAKV